MDHKERIEALVELTNRLADMTEIENYALAERRYEDVEIMLEDKATLARLYENRMKALHEAKFDMATLEDDIRKQLSKAAQRLDTAMAENTMRLDAGITASKQVVNIFAEAIKGAVPHTGTYSRKGATGQEGVNAAVNTMAVSLDQSL